MLKLVQARTLVLGLLPVIMMVHINLKPSLVMLHLLVPTAHWLHLSPLAMGQPSVRAPPLPVMLQRIV